jgi:hypothetical protein
MESVRVSLFFLLLGTQMTDLGDVGKLGISSPTRWSMSVMCNFGSTYVVSASFFVAQWILIPL